MEAAGKDEDIFEVIHLASMCVCMYVCKENVP